MTLKTKSGVLTDEQEINLLLANISEDAADTNAEEYRHMGDILRVITDTPRRTYLKRGQLLMVRRSGLPDSDQEYATLAVDEDGDVDSSYVHKDDVELVRGRKFVQIAVAGAAIRPAATGRRVQRRLNLGTVE
jgi:hypothetical protein